MTHDTQRRHLFFICVTNYSEVNAKVYIIKVLIIYNVNAVPSFPFVCTRVQRQQYMVPVALALILGR